jgi:hypothetical protein
MKIKKTLLKLVLITFVFISCKDDSIKCNGSREKETVIEILRDETLKQKFLFKNSLGIDEEYLHHFFDNNIKLSLIRTTGINKELKSCKCSAQLELSLKPEVISFTTDNLSGSNIEYRKEIINNLLNLKVDIDYRIQETDDDDFIVEAFVPDELGNLLSTSYIFESQYNGSQNNESQNNESQFDKSQFYESKSDKIFKVGQEVTFEEVDNGGGKFILTFLDDNKVKILYKYSDHEDIEIAEYKDGKIIQESGQDDTYQIKGKYLKYIGKDDDFFYQMKY